MSTVNGYRRFECYAVSTVVTDVSDVTLCRLEWLQTFRMLRRVDCGYRRFGCFAVSTVNGYRRFECYAMSTVVTDVSDVTPCRL